MRRDFDSVEELGNQILSANASNLFVHRALARQFDELEMPGKSRVHWQTLRDGDPGDFEAAFHLAHAHAREGNTLDEACNKAAPDATPTFRKNLREVLEEEESSTPWSIDLHNVVICGVSYSGTTLLDRLLGSLPETKSIGESHWLTKARTAQGYAPIDFGSATPIQLVHCSVCGPDCEVLDFAFRRRLAANHTSWYYKIADRLGTATLISADKNAPKIAEHDPLMRFDGIVMYKSLRQAWLSELTKRKKGESENYYLDECRKYVDVWTQSYKSFLEDLSPRGKVIVVSFEDFARRPQAVLERVAKSLALEFDERVLTSIQPGHAIGGNALAMAKLRQACYTPEIEPVDGCDLPAGHREIIEQNEEAKNVFERLQIAHGKQMAC